MNILLIYPEIPETFWSLKEFVKIIGKKSNYPPLGLLTVAALLPKDWNKKLIDLNVDSITEQDICWADYAFISAMNVQEISAKKIIKMCHEKKVKIVAGGPLFTFEYEYFSEVDHFILNEAEITLPMFLEDIKNGTPQRMYTSNEFADMSKSPIPLFNLINPNDYLNAIVQYSRGCPFSCEFCDVPIIFGKKPRTKTPEQIIAELEIIEKETLAGQVFFADDNLIGNKRSLKNELLPALISWRKQTNSSLYFVTQLTINLADDDELMKLLFDAGFRCVFIGIETLNESALLEARKKQNLYRSILDSIDKIHQSGFIVNAGFIIGFDSDSDDIFEQQINFINQSKITTPIINILKAPAGTPLYNRMKKDNRLKQRAYYSESDTNIITKMSADILYEGYKNVLSAVYAPKNYYNRIIDFIDKYDKVDFSLKNRQPIHQVILSVLKITYSIGLKSEVRKYFWKLVFKTLIKNYRLIPFSISQAIMIHQMQNTAKHVISEIPLKNKI